VDSDVLLPHNIARHALGHALVGMPKVDAMKIQLDTTLVEHKNTQMNPINLVTDGYERKARL